MGEPIKFMYNARLRMENLESPEFTDSPSATTARIAYLRAFNFVAKNLGPKAIGRCELVAAGRALGALRKTGFRGDHAFTVAEADQLAVELIALKERRK